MSNDYDAIKVLLNSGHRVDYPVVRFFDLLVLGFQAGELKEKDCDSARKALRGAGEYVPRCFGNASFSSGLSDFCPRLQDRTLDAVGRSAAASRHPFMACCEVTPWLRSDAEANGCV